MFSKFPSVSVLFPREDVPKYANHKEGNSVWLDKGYVMKWKLKFFMERINIEFALD